MLISIIVPFYNSEKTLEKCLESILKNDLNDCEVLCVNDGSIDSSVSIIKKYSKNYNYIKLIDNFPNKGVSYVRNLGIQNAKGSYLMFIDSDDTIESNALSNIKKFINKKYDLVIFNSKRTNFLNYKKRIKKEKIISNILCDKKIQGFLWNKVFRKEVITNYMIKFDESLAIGEDLDFCIEYVEKCEGSIIYYNKSLYRYNYCAGVTSKVDSHQKLIITLKKLQNKISDKRLTKFIFSMIIMHQIIILKNQNIMQDELKQAKISKVLFDRRLKIKYKLYFAFKKFIKYIKKHTGNMSITKK